MVDKMLEADARMKALRMKDGGRPEVIYKKKVYTVAGIDFSEKLVALAGLNSDGDNGEVAGDDEIGWVRFESVEGKLN